MIVVIRGGELNQRTDSTNTKDLAGSSCFVSDRGNIRVIQVNGETCLAKEKFCAWAKLNDKTWQV